MIYYTVQYVNYLPTDWETDDSALASPWMTPLAGGRSQKGWTNLIVSFHTNILYYKKFC